jgi:hypothetical protein
MIEVLEHLIEQVALHPKRARVDLYRELMNTETYLLTLDKPLPCDPVMRMTGARSDFSVWADQDPEMGGVWVPIFPVREAVGSFVAERHLEPPRGLEFLWMGHEPGVVFGLLRGVPCFAGLRLYLDGKVSVEIPWPEVRALAEGKLPSDGPQIYELSEPRLVLPRSAKILMGHAPIGGKIENLLVLPEAGHFKSADMRRLVRLNFDGHSALMPCRHFLQALRFSHAEEDDSYSDDMLRALLSFEMYGEAEALCDWLTSADKAGPFVAEACELIAQKTGRNPAAIQ